MGLLINLIGIVVTCVSLILAFYFYRKTVGPGRLIYSSSVYKPDLRFHFGIDDLKYPLPSFVVRKNTFVSMSSGPVSLSEFFSCDVRIELNGINTVNSSDIRQNLGLRFESTSDNFEVYQHEVVQVSGGDVGDLSVEPTLKNAYEITWSYLDPGSVIVLRFSGKGEPSEPTIRGRIQGVQIAQRVHRDLSIISSLATFLAFFAAMTFAGFVFPYTRQLLGFIPYQPETVVEVAMFEGAAILLSLFVSLCAFALCLGIWVGGIWRNIERLLRYRVVISKPD